MTAAGAAVLAGCATGSIGPPSGDSHSEALIDRFDALRVSAGIPGVAVAIVRDGRLAAARGLGFANVEARLPVTPQTPFDIASVAKPIAAVVALQLTRAGRLDLDRPMATFAGFGDFCAAARTSPGPFFRDVDCADPRLTLRTVMSMAANGTPGTRFFYNPPLFSWTSRPMAAAADTPYSTLVQHQVFDAAEMRRSARIHRQLALRADLAATLALPYRRGADGLPQRMSAPPAQGDGAAGGVISTALDLARFDVALDDGRLLDAAARRALGRAASPDLPYGLGWFLGRHGTRAVMWHTGKWEDRYSALYLKLLAADGRPSATLILLANSDGLAWPSRLDEATLSRSPFAQSFLTAMS